MGSTPRVYRNMLVFLAAEERQLDNVKLAMRSSLAWSEIVRESDRYNLIPSDAALARAKLSEAADTLKTRLKEAWCYLIYPSQESAQADIEWNSAKVPAQDGLLSRASKKLTSDEGLMPELGPSRLDRELQKYIWNGKPHLALADLWEYLNRYVYLPRVKDRAVLAKAVQTAVSQMVPGSFAYAERWDQARGLYEGLVISGAPNAQIVIDRDSVIVSAPVAEAAAEEARRRLVIDPPGPIVVDPVEPDGGDVAPPPIANLTRFTGTVLISPDRPARDMHQIVEAIVEQLTTIQGCEITLKLEIDAEVPTGLDRAKVRTLIENASTLGFIDKSVR